MGLSPTSAKIGADAYGYQIDRNGRGVDLYRYSPEAKGAIKVATIWCDGEIIPCASGDSTYSREDHECAMAIRALVPVTGES